MASCSLIWLSLCSPSSPLRAPVSAFSVPTLSSSSPLFASTLHGSSSSLTPSGRECSDYDVVLGGSIYDPAYYSSLFEDGQYSRRLRLAGYTLLDQNSGVCDDGSTSSAEASQVKVTTRRAFEAVDVGLRKFVRDNGDFQ